MNIKKIICFSLLFYLTAYPQFSQDLPTKSDMMNMGTISVTIGGSFPINGTFPALITERVDEFVTRMYNESVARSTANAQDENFLEKIKKDLTQFSLRGIVLKRSNSEELIIDLEKFRLYGDFNNNPYLKNDDILIFPPYDIDRNFFTINGAVNTPGKFFYVNGDKLSDAIQLARGLNPAYENVQKAEIKRLDYRGENQETIEVNLDSDVTINRGDQIIILADETQRKDFYVLVLGEINQPGYIPIAKTGTKLGEVINLVKGFTENASLKRSRIFRGNSITPLLESQYGIKIGDDFLNKNPEVVNRILAFEQAMMFRMSNLVEEDEYYFETENQYRVLNEGSAIDFTQADDENSEIYNFILESGDVIIVPPQAKTVYVFGQVSSPGHVKFEENKDYMYYLEQAGGIGEYAEDEIMIIKGSSRNWVIALPSIKIEDGDYIFVPKQRIKSFQSSIAEWSMYFAIIGSIATVLLLIVQLTE